MAQNRDDSGRFAAVVAANAGGSEVAPPVPSARTSTAELRSVPDPASIENPSTTSALTDHMLNPRPPGQAPALPQNAPVTVPDYTRGLDVLTNNSGGSGGGSGSYAPEDTQSAAYPQYPEAVRARGWTGAEHPGDHAVIDPMGRAAHGADVPGPGGIPAPADVSGSDL